MKKFIFAVAALFLASPLFAQVTVQGTGTVFAKPDCVHLNFAVVSENPQAAKAHADNKVSSDALFAAIKNNKVEDKDVTTVGFSINPKFTYVKDDEPKLSGYKVVHQISVKVHDAKTVGALIDSTVANNVRLEGIQFVISDRSELVAKARDLAIADAKKRAEHLVTGLNEKLGGLVSVSESEETERLYPRGLSRLSSEGPAPTNIASGEQAVVVHVNAVFEVSKVKHADLPPLKFPFQPGQPLPGIKPPPMPPADNHGGAKL